MINKICVAGAGTMGSGIALTAAQANFTVVLYDSNAEILSGARKTVETNLNVLLQKGRITDEELLTITGSISYHSEITNCQADLVIEAIIEDETVKTNLFQQLAELNRSDCIIASNTSSLSIDKLQAQLSNPDRFAGMHFFNPAHLMKLVEVVKGSNTSETTVRALTDACKRMNKTAVVCKDAPGFIVNRIARHYYLEAMRVAEKYAISPETIDEIMEATGFKMGPFRLMDLIGMDINLAVSQSLYKAFNQELRFQPSAMQIDKVQKGQLGRKTGQGFYAYNN